MNKPSVFDLIGQYGRFFFREEGAEVHATLFALPGQPERFGVGDTLRAALEAAASVSIREKGVDMVTDHWVRWLAPFGAIYREVNGKWAVEVTIGKEVVIAEGPTRNGAAFGAWHSMSDEAKGHVNKDAEARGLDAWIGSQPLSYDHHRRERRARPVPASRNNDPDGFIARGHQLATRTLPGRIERGTFVAPGGDTEPPRLPVTQSGDWVDPNLRATTTKPPRSNRDCREG